MQPTPSTTRLPLLMLPARMALFLFFQALIAAGLALTRAPGSWQASGAWWPFTVTATNLTCLALLTRFYRAEGCRYWDIFRIDRRHWKNDLLAMLGMLVIAGPVAMLPNTMLATVLYGDAMAPVRLFLAPLPTWAIYASMVLFPITQGLVELPFYFNYIMPRLSTLTQRPWLSYGLASLFLGLQHMMAPLLLDGRFITWRALMYIPFGFLVGGMLKWRPRLLPYLAIVHVIIDFGAASMYLMEF